MANPPTGADTRTCSACGSEIDAGVQVCPDCGATQEDHRGERGRPTHEQDRSSRGRDRRDRGDQRGVDDQTTRQQDEPATTRRDASTTGRQDDPATTRRDEPSTDGQREPTTGAGRDDTGESTPGTGQRGSGSHQQSTGSGPEPKSRLFAAGIGALVSFVVGWVPVVGPLFGGLAAGYLRGNEGKEGALSGLIANAIASVPLLLLVLLFLTLGGIGAVAQGDGQAAVGMVLWLVIFAGGFAYFYALGAIGGLLGAVASDRGSPE